VDHFHVWHIDFMALSPYEASVSAMNFAADMMEPSAMDFDQELSVEVCDCKRACIVKLVHVLSDSVPSPCD
jgi:hypothetical protein